MFISTIIRSWAVLGLREYREMAEALVECSLPMMDSLTAQDYH